VAASSSVGRLGIGLDAGIVGAATLALRWGG